MLKNQEPTKDKIIAALKASNGNVVKAAYKLKVSKSWLYKKINSSKIYQDSLKEIRYEIVDEAEEGLRELIRKRDPAAIIYCLKSMGKDRGWSQSQQW